MRTVNVITVRQDDKDWLQQRKLRLMAEALKRFFTCNCALRAWTRLRVALLPCSGKNSVIRNPYNVLWAPADLTDTE